MCVCVHVCVFVCLCVYACDVVGDMVALYFELITHWILHDSTSSNPSVGGEKHLTFCQLAKYRHSSIPTHL